MCIRDRKYGTMILVSVIVFLGHWVDTFQMIKPGALHTSHEASVGVKHMDQTGEAAKHLLEGGTTHAEIHNHAAAHFVSGFTIPGLPEIGLMLGFLALFIGTTLHFLSRAPLVPKKDPFLNESLHHHV